MKVLELQQPWAQLVVTGAIDTINLDFGTDFRGKVLIYASAEPMTEDFFNDIPVEWAKSISNEQAFGNIGINQDLPLNAVVGFAELTDCATGNSPAFWAGSPQQFHWKFENAEIFDSPHPIEIVGGVWGECDIEEKAMPTHEKAVLNYPQLEGTTLNVVVSELEFWDMPDAEDFSFYVDLHADYAKALFSNTDDVEKLSVSRICFRHHDFTADRMVKMVAYCAEKGEDGADV
ncbi:MAG: hypothetical protein HUJ98_12635, partial [Bacteroidaceae bacterium]|nr:hypothetical protein [Bacteroidaceae bacterium]